MTPESSEVQENRNQVVVHTTEELDAILEQGEPEVDPRLVQVVRKDVAQRERQKIVEQARAIGLDIRVREPTQEEEAALEAMQPRRSISEAVMFWLVQAIFLVAAAGFEPATKGL